MPRWLIRVCKRSHSMMAITFLPLFTLALWGLVDFNTRIVLHIMLVSFVWIFFWGSRVWWVSTSRIDLIELDFMAYQRLPHFEFMVNTFWLWQVGYYYRLRDVAPSYPFYLNVNKKD